MPLVGPIAARWLAVPAFAVLATAGGRVVEGVVGPAPIVALSVAFAALWVWGAGGGATRPASPPGAGLLLLAPFALSHLLDLALPAVGTQARQAGLPTVAVAPLVALVMGMASWPAGRVARRAAGAGAGAAAVPLAAAAGVALGWWLPATVGLLAPLPALWLADRVPAPHRGWTPRRAPQHLRGPSVVLSAAAGAAAWMALRSLSDPSATGAVVAVVSGLLGVAAGRILPQPRPGSALVAAGFIAGLACLTVVGAPAVGAGPAATLARTHPGVVIPLLLAAPAALGLAGGIGVGFARGSPRSVAWGAAGGLAMAAAWPHLLPWLPVLAGVAALLAATSRRTWWLAAGLTAAGLATALVVPFPPASALAAGTWRVLREETALPHDQEVRAGLRDAWAHWSARGVGAVRAPSSAWTSGAQGPWQIDVELDGVVAGSTGRDADAEALAGHLGGLLAGSMDHAVILGDDTGRVSIALSDHGFPRIDTATPSPDATRAVAALDGAARQAWLRPASALRDAHPELLLRLTARADAIVEVVRTPWADATHGAPAAGHLTAVRRRLAPGGVYVLCVHLTWFPQGAPAALAGELAERFAHLQVWLPPTGADSVIFVASDERPPLGRLLTRAAVDEEPLAALGLARPELLASLAVASEAGARAWAEGAGGAAFAPTGLSDTLTARPVQHLASLAAHVETAATTWEVTGTPPPPRLDDRIAGHRRYLELLDRASRGDMEGVFDLAGVLSGSDDDNSALDALIQPHIASAREALRRSGKEGAAGWEEATRYATTARMLSPRSPEPRLVLGEIALAQGNLNRAGEEFGGAAELDPGNLAASWGLARTARVRHDLVGAEAHLRTGVRYHPRNWRAWHNLGVFLSEVDRPEEAERNLRRASDLAGNEEVAPRLALARVYLALGRPTLALAEAERSARQGGGAMAWYLHGRAWYDLEEYDQAEDDFRRAVLQDPSLVEARGGVGLVRAVKGDLEGAAEAFRAVLRVDPDNGAARENLRRAEQALRDAAPPPTPPPAQP